MSERNIFEGIGETVEFEIENTDALKELFNKTKEENLKIQKRFADGTYTEDDLLNHSPRFGLGTKDKIEMDVVESKYFEDLANRYTNLKEIEQLHKEENGKLRVELEQKEKIIKRLEQDVEGYSGLSKQIQKDYSNYANQSVQIREYGGDYNE